MGWDDLPEHLDSPEEWAGKDDSKHWYTDWRRYVKGWFAFSFNQRMPRVIWAIKAKAGLWRYECDLYDRYEYALINSKGWYLSRVQYLSKWHVQLQWPLFFAGHVGKWQWYVGLKRDADKIFWLALYCGRCWK